MSEDGADKGDEVVAEEVLPIREGEDEDAPISKARKKMQRVERNEE